MKASSPFSLVLREKGKLYLSDTHLQHTLDKCSQGQMLSYLIVYMCTLCAVRDP